MEISKEGINLIKRFEGCRLTAYKCAAGVWTIGYGHTKGVIKGQTISQEEADKLLKNDLKDFEQKVNRLELKINQNQFDALVSFAFNVGMSNLQKSTLLRKIKADANDKTIRQEFLKWTFAAGKHLEGLVRRRNAEADLYFAYDKRI